MSATAKIDDAARPRWYVARSGASQERLARASLRADGIDAYLPMTFKTNRKGELFALPLFPGFLFVRLRMGEAAWPKVFSARGVAAVLSSGGRPTPVRDQVVEWIRSQELDHFAERGLQPEPCRAFEPGQLVRIKKGPFAELCGVFKQMDGKKRCQVLVLLMGAERLAHAEVEHVEAA